MLIFTLTQEHGSAIAHTKLVHISEYESLREIEIPSDGNIGTSLRFRHGPVCQGGELMHTWSNLDAIDGDINPC